MAPDSGMMVAPSGDQASDDEETPQSPALSLVPPGPKKKPAPVPLNPAVQGSALVASRRDPKRWAKVLELSHRLQMPDADFVDRNFDALAKADQQSSNREATSAFSPTFQNWLTDPNNFTVAQHETAPLARLDNGAKLVAHDGGMLDDVGTATATGAADLASAAGHLGVAFGLTTPAQAAAFVADMNQRAASLRSQAPDYAKDFTATMQEHAGDVDKALSAFARGQDGQRSAGILAALKMFAIDPTIAATKGIQSGTLGEVLHLIGAAAARPRGLAYQGLESLASMAPMLGGSAGGGMAGAGLGSLAGPLGTAVGATVGSMAGTFVGMAPINVGSEINAELTRRGVDVTDPAALERAFNDPHLMASIRSKAERAGVTNAAVVSLFSGFAGKLLAGAEGAGLATKAAAATGDVSIQAGGMGVAQMAGQAASGQHVSPGEAMQTAMSMLGVGGAMEAIGASRRAAFHPHPIEAAAQATTHAERAFQALHDAQALSEIGAAVKEAPTTASLPERIKSLVETATGGQEAGNVYFQTADFDRHFTEQGLSPAKAAADIMGDEGRAYADAKSTGSALAIPLGDYVARVAPTEHWDGLLNVARTKVEGLTLGEAHEYLQSLPATMQDIAHEATNTPAPVEDSAKLVGSAIENQLMQTGLGPVASRAHGALYESAFRTLGARTGSDPKELFDRFNISVRRAKAQETIDQAKVVTAANPSTTEPTPAEEQAAANLADETLGARPRTASGRLKNLEKATLDEIANEYRILVDANAVENVAPSSIENTNSGVEQYVGIKPAAMKALGRVAARSKTIANLEAEFQARGIDPADAYQRADENAKMQSEDAFPFGANAFDQAARGRIVIAPDAIKIELLEHADRSTFIHESGHALLGILDTLGSAKDAPADLVADRSAVRDWLGVEGSAPLTKDQHEQFARGFEAYLMEGEAPSPALRTAFQRFKNWLLTIYKQASALNVTLTPEVRGVFDRLLASHEEIARASQDQHVAPLFDNPRAVGMNETQANSYEKAVTAAREAAEEELTAKLMKGVRRAESAEWKAWREPIRADVEKEINSSPVYRALEYLKDGRNPDGSAFPAEMPLLKLNRRAVEDLGERGASLIKRGLTDANGEDPDMIADLLGFSSGAEMLDQLIAAPSRVTAIEAETNARMQAAHGERLTDADVAKMATETLHGEKRALLLRKELEHLASDNLPALKGLVRKVTGAIPPTDVIKAQAREVVGRTTVRAMRPDLFERAAERAAVQAREALLRGDVQGAFDAKRQELLATEVFNAAKDAKAIIEGSADEFKKMFGRDERLAESRDMDLVNTARSILASFGIGRTDKPAAAYLDQTRLYDEELAGTLQGMVDDATAGGVSDWRALSFERFVAMRDAVTAIWELSRSTRQIEIDGQKMDRLEVQKALGARLAELTPAGPKAGYHEAVTPWERTKVGLLGFKAAGRRVESWVTAMDNGAEGPFRRFLWNPIREAATRFRVAKADVTAKYAEVVKGLHDMPKPKQIPAQEIGYTFKDMNELLGAMLHTGNGYEKGSNGYKLLVGRQWGNVGPDGAVDSTNWRAFVARMQASGVLTKAHYDWLQQTGDLFEELKPAAWKAHKAMYGYYPADVTAVAVPTPHGTYRGWYYPAKVDPFLVSDAQVRAERDVVMGSDNAFAFPSTGKGFTMTRNQAYARPLMLDASAVPVHLDYVLRFTHIQPHVREVGRMLLNRDLRAQLDEFDPAAASDMLTPWLQRAASQRGDQPMKGRAGRLIDTFAREIRSRSGMQIMAANAIVTAEQFTHFPSVLAHPDVKGVKLLDALWSFTRHPQEMAESIAERSPFMATRESAAMMEARKGIDKVLLDPSKTKETAAWIRDNANVVMRGIQSVMDAVTWSAVYDHVVEGGVDETEAVRRADSVIREALGSYAPEDLSRFETGNSVSRLFSMFYSFYNTKANFMATHGVIASRMGLRKGAGRMLGLYTVGFLIPAMLGKAIKLGIAGEPFQEDDETGAHAALRFWGESQLEMAERFVPFVGTLVDRTLSHFGKPSFGSGSSVLNSPAIKMLEDAVDAPGEVYQSIRDGMYSKRATTDFFTLLGMASNLPLRPVAKGINWLHEH